MQHSKDNLRLWAVTFLAWLAILPAFATAQEATIGGMPDAVITQWAWDGPNLLPLRTALANPANFGPAGTDPTQSITTVTRPDALPANLAGLNVFVSSWWPDTDASAAEIDAVRDYFLAGGNLLLMQDDPSHDPIGAALGIASAGFSGVFPNPSNDVGGSPLHTGPFGTAANVLQHYTKGFLAAADIAAHGGTVSSTRADGEISAAYWNAGDYAPGAGRMIVLADVDMCAQTALGVGAETGDGLFNGADYAPLDDNGRFCLNAISFLLGQSPGDAVLVQAVPAGSETVVAVRVTGAADATIDTVELLTSASCVDGQLGEDAEVFAAITDIPLDGNGEALFIGAVSNNPSTTVDNFAIARVVGAAAVGPPSACIVAGPDNDSWTRAAEIALTVDSTTTSSGSDIGYIDATGKSRWFRFAIQPGARATIDLSALPADYDLAVFKDIGQAFQDLVGDTDVDGLNRLSAEFAPSVFSPSVFSPSVFSPSVFSPDAYAPSVFSPSVFSPSVFSPSVFSPSVFSPSVFSPSVFSPSVFSPSVFSPSVFSPSVFSPSVFSPSVFSPDTFASVQTRSLIAVSAQPGTGTERVIADTWSNTGDFYIRVSGKNGAADVENPFQLSVTLDGALCNGVVPEAPLNIIAPAGGYETIILWDAEQIRAAPGYSEAAATTLLARLEALAARDEVRGVVVDLSDPAFASIQSLHAQADAASSCPYAENLTARAIKEVVDAYRANNPLAYIVIAGSDSQVPFFRYADQALLGPEQDYDPPMADGTQSQSALRLNYVLGQDEYGATSTLSLSDGQFPLPNLAVGRLVESPAEMITVLDAYLATTDGVVATPRSTLVTGYDFLEDAANQVQAELVIGTADDTATIRNDTLVTAANISPDDPLSWTADDLRSELLDEGEDIVFLAGHFSANSSLAADYQTTVLVTDLTASAVDLTNSLIFSAGCHSGYNIVDGDIVPNVTLPLDWAQAFARKGATLVAGTGYQYGDTDFVEYSERLYVEFARALRSGTGAISIGQALVRAKQKYLADTPDIRGLHRKSVLISTVFGLPMLRMDLPGERIPDDSGMDEVAPQQVACTGPNPTACAAVQLGLQAADLSLSFNAGEVVERTVEFTDLRDPTGATKFDATYLLGPNGVVTNPAEPALPLKSVNVAVDSLALRGVGFRGGDWTERLLVPLTGAPTTELRGVHTPFASLVNFPMRLATANYYGAIAQTGKTLLHVTPAQHRVANLGDENATLRQFDNLDFRLFYSSNTQTYGANRPALAGPPTMTSVRAVTVSDGTNDNADVLFLVNAVGDPSAGIVSVWITYTDGDASAGTWVPLDLTQDPVDSTLWSGRLVGGVSAFSRLDYLVLAVNGVGLVSIDDNYGAYYRIAGAQGEVGTDGNPTSLMTSQLELSGPLGAPLPAGGVYGGAVQVEARLTAAGGAPIDDASVLFTIGATSRAARTTSDGFAAVDLPLNATPGNYILTASFAGDAARSASSAEAAFNVAKAGTTLTLATAPQSVGVENVQTGVSATLRDQYGTPLPQRTVYFTLAGGPDGSLTVPAITNNVGVAGLGAVVLPPQSYGVTARFLGTIPTGAATLTLSDPVYLASSAALDLDLIGGVNCPSGNVDSKLELVGFCYLAHQVGHRVSMTDGTLIVGGATVVVSEEGTIVSDGGGIDHTINQYGPGSVRILESASVSGNVYENGPGDIVVFGEVGRSVTEHEAGDIVIGETGVVGGDAIEHGAGTAVNNGSVAGKVIDI